MSILDRIVAAVTPPESREARMEARAKAERAAASGDWLSQIIQHHRMLEQAFTAVRAAANGPARMSALKRLNVLLTGHSIAEEAVIYPALVQMGEKGHADHAYDEQAMAKVQMAMLEQLDPMSQEFIDKLEHIEGAVSHHMYHEEDNWLIDLKESASAEEQSMLTARYAEEFQRYVGVGSA